jgi:hypothetical protein
MKAPVLVSVSLLCGTLLSAHAMAYSLQNHETLTHESVALVSACQRCAGDRGPAIEGLEALLVASNLAQDALHRKLMLWHFPRRASDDLPGVLAKLLHTAVVCDHFEPWTDALWRRVVSGLPPEELYPALGAALHYVQDMAVPAHVVPVFHPAGLFDPTDAFDDYADWPRVSPTSDCAQLAPTCARVSAPVPLPDLLTRAAASTRAALRAPLWAQRASTPTSLSWSELWRAERGFGQYGPVRFGDTHPTIDGTEYVVSPLVYQVFARQRAAQAVEDGATTIFTFERHLRGARAAKPPDDAALKRWLPSHDALSALCRP